MTVQPLPERIETTRQGKDDIDTNRRFLAIMEHPDNADIVRAINVGLATADPVADDEDTREPDGPTRPPMTGLVDA